MAADPKAIVGAFIEGMDVSPQDMERARLWLQIQIAQELQHICSNIAAVCEHFEIEYTTAPFDATGDVGV